MDSKRKTRVIGRKKEYAKQKYKKEQEHKRTLKEIRKYSQEKEVDLFFI